MTEYVEVRTQSELDAALKRPGVIPICLGNGRFEARGSSHVVAWESSHVEARGSSHVEAWGSSHVVAWGSSHVVAWESSHVVAWESSHVVASPFVAVHRFGDGPKVSGGVLIQVPRISTVEDWCDYYGIKPKRGVVTLFKAVGDDYVSSRDFAYRPGTRPECPDWDPNPNRECGGGLHMCPSPSIAKSYRVGATRYVACPVKLGDVVVVPGRDVPPDKVRASRVHGDVFEVDVFGEPVKAEAVA